MTSQCLFDRPARAPGMALRLFLYLSIRPVTLKLHTELTVVELDSTQHGKIVLTHEEEEKKRQMKPAVPVLCNFYYFIFINPQI